MSGLTEPDSLLSEALSPVGEVLLSHLDLVRDLLARRMIQEHHMVTDPDLNYRVVSTLLQLLFLKTGQECRFVEPGTLAALERCDGIAKRMECVCSDAGLSPEIFFEKGSEDLRIIPPLSDMPLREIIQRLEISDFPSPLTRLPLEEFAAVMEYFLGSRMHVDEGYQVKRVGKSALLYTGTVDVPPQRIIEYIASLATGKITDGSMMSDTPSGRVLDPACGAGLFLLAAYRLLTQKKTRAHDYPDPTGTILREILCRSVVGTDIDPESVSAARFVLLLAFIEENRQFCRNNPTTDQVRKICACLAKNIRCGNSLIAPDYFTGKPVFPFNVDERRKVNPFDWKTAFPEIMDKGGFDAVIGAPPPYRPLVVKTREDYFQIHYNVYSESAGLYGYFIEKGLALLKPSGIMSVLVPGTFLRSQHARPLRRLLLTRQLGQIACTGRTRVLPGGEAMMYSLTLHNRPPEKPFIVSPVWNSSEFPKVIFFGKDDFMLDQRVFDDGGWKLNDTRIAKILKKVQEIGTPLDQYVMGKIDFGRHMIRNNPLVVDQATKSQLTKKAWWCRRFFIPLLRPANIRRYVPESPDRFVLVIRDNRDLRTCRALITNMEKMVRNKDRKSGVKECKENLNPVSDVITIPLSFEFEENRPKIIFSEYQQDPAFCFDVGGTYEISSTLLAINRNDLFLAGILNSSLGRFIITHTCPITERGYHTSPAALGKLPIYVIDFDNPDDKVRHDRMVALVTGMLDLHKHLSLAKTDQEKRLIQQEIDSTEKQIDSLVYGIYGLSVDEIAVVEGSALPINQRTKIPLQ